MVEPIVLAAMVKNSTASVHSKAETDVFVLQTVRTGMSTYRIVITNYSTVCARTPALTHKIPTVRYVRTLYIRPRQIQWR